ncbi:hypothetical protein QJS10_CPB13g01102 [Acorus calamus]|uniref:FAD-binding domain-containing protein n=1 Tax=Acorus calamus TaxID=4465 RepID=A0AAV9DIW7_ACOCL|nr:hypothetical protein QJS10_CPB13g01102 [Acorus calamus]
MENGIVIVGAGICGLATALALHRKGLKSIVLERSNGLRSDGGALEIHNNGWHVLDQLGIATELREKAIRLEAINDVLLDTGKTVERTLTGKEELRCMKRKDLIEALFNAIPREYICFGCQVKMLKTDAMTSFPELHCSDGSIIKAKILIGCDGVNSVIAKSLKLANPRFMSICATRGLTSYPNSHGLENKFTRVMLGTVDFGLLTITDNLVHWFIGRPMLPTDSESQNHPELIKKSSLDALKGFPQELIDTVKQCDLDSLYLTQVKYRAPWDLFFTGFRNGTITVAGDAMHAMGPFQGQGAGSSLEDAIVLARCIAREMCKATKPEGGIGDHRELQQRIEGAMDRYMKERRLRIIRCSLQTYVVGMLLGASSMVKKLLVLAVYIIFFGGTSLSLARFDCGHL